MKILMISDVYFPRINGVSTSIESFRSELSTLGIHSTLIAPAYPQTKQVSDPDLVSIPSRFLPMDPEDRMMQRGKIRDWIKTQTTSRYDLVHIHTPFIAHYAGIEIARQFNAPVIASYHTYFEEYLHHYIPFLPKRLMRATARRFSRSQCKQLDAVIVPSTAMANTLREYGVTQTLHVLPTGLRQERFVQGDGAGFRERLGIPPDRPLMLFVGRVAFEKNIEFLLRVTEEVRRKLPDVLFLITGEGPALQGLKKRTQALGLDQNVSFVGYLDRHGALADCYCAADLFVFASRTETQGLVLLEAMAMGCPVLSLSVMGTRDILENTPGAIIAEDNIEDFSGKAIELLSNRAKLKTLGQNAIQSAQKWSAAEMAQQLSTLYTSLIK
jgi:1,2-diacylglycerol 3-alpha-glucosyltransferase